MEYKVGDLIHGYASGSFGRDSYSCRRVEAVGPDWIVTRNERSEVELATSSDIPDRDSADDRTFCHEDCTGPDQA